MKNKYSKKYKVIVIGLPKTGTSTLTVMLRVLKYNVTGPDINYNNNDAEYLLEKFKEFNAFQDYPWCFEWERFINEKKVKFIILKRNVDLWWRSFYESYDKKGNNYLSSQYFNIPKSKHNKEEFYNYYHHYYNRAETLASKFQDKFLIVELEMFQWEDLCVFLDEDLPRGIFGKIPKKPHVNKLNSKMKQSFKYKLLKKIKDLFVLLFGNKKYISFVSILRKNNIV